jgi:hypothetical protein
LVAHRGQMRPAGNQADVCACARELHTEKSADRAGAVDADFHQALSKSGLQNVNMVRYPDFEPISKSGW